MSSASQNGLNRQINAEAARWFVEFRSGEVDAPGRQAFDTWLRASPEHLRAFLEIAALWGRGPELDPQRRYSLEALVASVREESNVVPLGGDSNWVQTDSSQRGAPLASTSSASGRSPPSGRFTASGARFGAVAAAAVVLILVISLLAWVRLHDRNSYSTQIGEQRSLTLSDGSRVTLNSRSRVRIAYSESTRAIDLVEGEALFHVAKETSRPFVVHAAGSSVRAVGTEFDINQKSRGTLITVVEGRVAVLGAFAPNSVNLQTSEIASSARPSPAAGEPVGTVLLCAGEQIDVTAGASTQPARSNVSSATAWVQRKVILQSATLAEVAEDFNRYSERPLVVEEHGAVPFRVSGVFSTDPEFLIRFLRERPDIQVRETATEIRIIHTGAQ